MRCGWPTPTGCRNPGWPAVSGAARAGAAQAARANGSITMVLDLRHHLCFLTFLGNTTSTMERLRVLHCRHLLLNYLCRHRCHHRRCHRHQHHRRRFIMHIYGLLIHHLLLHFKLQHFTNNSSIIMSHTNNGHISTSLKIASKTRINQRTSRSIRRPSLATFGCTVGCAAQATLASGGTTFSRTGKARRRGVP